MTTTEEISGLAPEAPHAPVLRSALLVMMGVLAVGVLRGAQSITENVESRFGAYRAEITLNAEAERYPELNSWSASVFDSAGTVLYRLERQVPYDTPFPALALSDQGGAALLLNGFDGIVEFIDRRGSTVRRWRPFASEIPSHERILKCSIAGGRAALLLSDPLEPAARVAAMTMDGTLQAAVVLSERHAGELFLSNDGELIAASGSTSEGEITVSTSLLAWQGELLETIAFDMRLAARVPGTTTMLLADTRMVLALDLETGHKRRLWAEDRPEAIITTLRALEPGVVIGSQVIEFRSGPPVYTRTRVVLVSPSGITRLDRQLEGEGPDPVEADYTGREIRVSVGTATTSLVVPR